MDTSGRPKERKEPHGNSAGLGGIIAAAAFPKAAMFLAGGVVVAGIGYGLYRAGLYIFSSNQSMICSPADDYASACANSASLPRVVDSQVRLVSRGEAQLRRVRWTFGVFLILPSMRHILPAR